MSNADSFADDFYIRLIDAVDSAVTVEFFGLACGEYRGFKAQLRGPRCQYARTLPAVFAGERGRDGRVIVAVQDPCYWTAELPFLYDLSLEWIDASGARTVCQRAIGLKRWTMRGGSFYSDGERTVLRGVRVEAVTEAIVAEARRMSSAILLPDPSEDQCDLADLHGAVMIADLRRSQSAIKDLCSLACRPSVALVLVDNHQLMPCDLARFPSRPPLAVAHYAEADELGPSYFADWTTSVVVELEPESRPPGWMSTLGKPVIAIRRGESYAGLSEARAACDQLQAELAPEFDLAGYFV